MTRPHRVGRDPDERGDLLVHRDLRVLGPPVQGRRDAFYGGPSSGVPTAVALFTGDTVIRTLAERANHIVRWTRYDSGGHFAALQAPDLLAADIRAFSARWR
ncbi:hypothetical protein [Allosalinactinospora lopnorensis]|uniref:hypothetical protein n=1 Tax=Allosalinactinospora lopnorensis TaxID=1352348 RepID=UPI00191BE363|nr:hypothetical protein [Allosalinactinospora lopnorensis]